MLKLDPNVVAKIQKSFQAELYRAGEVPVFHLRKDLVTNTWKLIRLGETHAILTPQDQIPYSYVILQQSGIYELRLSLSNHLLTADYAQTVAAAGEIRFQKNGKILSINDKSGGYHINPSDPQAKEIQAESACARQAVGLPTDCFYPFEDLTTPLLFSTLFLGAPKITPAEAKAHTKVISPI
jgi:hypothetical protein